MKPYARIDGLIASEANLAVLIRRAPGRWVRLYTWSFDDDVVVAGDWIRGRVYSHRADVSSNGRYLAVFIWGIPGANHDAIVICNPPSATPVAKWNVDGSYGGAGIWESNESFLAMPDPYLFECVVKPTDFRVKRSAWIKNPDVEIHRRRLLKLGWSNPTDAPRRTLWQWLAGQLPWVGPSFHLRKDIPKGRLECWYGYELERVCAYDQAGNERLRLESNQNHPQWMDVDRSGRLVYSERGCLYAWKNFPGGEPELIADLNDLDSDPPPIGFKNFQ